MKRWAGLHPGVRQELEGFGSQGVPGEHHLMDAVVHGDELHGIPRMCPDTPWHDMLFGPPSTQHDSMKTGSPFQSQNAGPLQLRISKGIPPGATATQERGKEEKKQEAGPSQGDRLPRFPESCHRN